MNTKLAKTLILVAGLVNTLTFAAILFFPGWFFVNIGHFAPFNRHYMGDLGAFMLPLAIALIWASRDPERYRGWIIAWAASTTLHLLNHAFDAGFNGLLHSSHWVLDFVPLVFLVLVVLVPLLLKPERVVVAIAD